MTSYPKRDRYFAHRFCRLLTKSAAAQELGPAACWLLTVIVHQEDVKRYRGPVTFYNTQLMPLVGLPGHDSFARARDRAVAAGYLHYEPGAKAKPGRYWVLIPADLDELSDTPVDEDTFPIQESKPEEPGKQTGRNRKANRKKPESKPQPFYPIPNPNPKRGAPSPAAHPQKAEDVPVPPNIDTPAVRDAIAQWLAQRRERHFSTTPAHVSRQYARLADLTPDQAAACLNYSTDNGYQGLFPDKFQKGPNNAHRTYTAGPGQVYQGPELRPRTR